MTASLLLVTSLWMLVPLSLRVIAPDDGPAGNKDQSTPFPCQNRPCGCKSAQQCWKKCCCFSHSQKVAWAKANKVTPPAFVVKAALEEASVAAGATDRPAICCAHMAAAKTTDTGENPSKKAQPVRARTRFVVGVDELRCQGIEQTLSGQLISIQPPENVSLIDFDNETCEVISLIDFPLSPAELEPPTPPPRILMA